ncbi:MAG: PatB family C-S lyase [Bacteroidota bacterium]
MISQSYFDSIIDRKNTNCVKYDLLKSLYGREDLISMWVADMDFETPPFIIEYLKKRIDHHFFGYSFRNKSFNKSVQRWLKLRHEWQINEEWVTFCPGIVPALNFAVMAFSDVNDEIIVQTPVYTPFFGAIKDHNRVMIENPLIIENGCYKMDFDGLKKCISKKTKIFLLCSPHNPVGRVWNREELKKLSEICLENNILIISDEIHQDIVYSPHVHIPLGKINPEIAENSIICISPSKTFNIAGLSSSAIIISDELKREKFIQVINKFHLSQGNIFGNIALESAYNYGETYVDELVNYLKNNIDFTLDFLSEYLPDIKVTIPESTYLLWLDFSKYHLPQKKLNDLLINKAGLALSDGRIYGRGGTGFQRMNIALPKEVLEKGLNQLYYALEK